MIDDPAPNFLKSLSSVRQKYGVLLLLWISLLFKGGRTPATFLVWATLVLLFIAIRLRVTLSALSLKLYWKELVLALCLGLSQVYSRDSSISLYYTIQAFTFLALWISLKSDPSALPDIDLLVINLTAMALLSLGVSCFQMLTREWKDVHGFLPYNPIFNASLIGGAGTILVAFLVGDKSGRRKYTRGLWFTAGIMITGCLALPARSSCIALATGLMYALRKWLSLQRVLTGIVILLVTLGALLAVPGGILVKRLRVNDGNYRNKIWAVALQGALEHPWTGFGMGNFEMIYQKHAFPVETDRIRFARTTEFAHDEFLQIAADLGFPAFVLITLGVFSALFMRRVTTDRQRISKSILIVLTVVALYNIIWHLPFFVYLTILCFRFLLPELPSSARLTRRRISHSELAVVCMAFLLLFVASGWFVIRDHYASEGHWEKILRINPYDASAWTGWADQQRDLQLAITGYSRAVGLVPDEVYFHEYLGLALEASRLRSNYTAAIQEYLAGLELAPNRAPDALAIGRILYILNEPQNAMVWFKRALSMEPHYWECNLWIARCLYRAGKTERANEMLKDLRIKHDAYGIWRKRMEDQEDLPTPNLHSGYEQKILSFNGDVLKSGLLTNQSH
jgi:O-antigen ligase